MSDSILNIYYRETLDKIDSYEEYISNIRNILDEKIWTLINSKERREEGICFPFDIKRNYFYVFREKGKYINEAKEIIENHQIEEDAYNEAVNIDTEDSYRNYLKDFPNSWFSPIVQEKMNNILVKKENERWENALKENLSKLYFDYIQDYPKGIYRQEAQKKYTKELEKEKDIQKLIDYAKEYDISNYSIPHDIKSLKNTTKIEFWSDKIEKLPKEICKLEKLTKLAITYCPQLEELPLWLNDLKNLKELEISQTNDLPNISNLNRLVEFEYSFPESKEGFNLSELMDKLPKSIEVLKLRRKGGGAWNSKLPKKLIEFINLKELYLKDFRIPDSELPKWINDIKSLKKLFLEDIYIEKIPDFLTNLEVLSIGLSEKSDSSYSIAKLINLKELSIKGKIPEDIGELINLKQLSIDTTNKLPSSIGNIINLEKLEIKNYRLREVPNWIEKLKKLKKLSISGGYSTHTLIEIIPTWIGDLKNLKDLDFNHNYIKYLPESIGNLKNLETLNLGSNKLIYLPESIERLNKLKYLNCYNNKLTYLPKSIGNIKYLLELSISNNSLKSLPKSIDNFIYINLENLKKDVVNQIIKNKEREVETLRIFNLICEIDKPISNLEELSKIKKLKIKLESNDDRYYINGHLIERLVSLEELEVFGSSSDLGLKFNIDNEFIGLKKLKKLTLNKIETLFYCEKVLSYLDLKELSIETWDAFLVESINSLEILKLRSLNYRYNTPMPEKIDKLKNLKEFYFTGTSTRIIPEAIGNLNNLELLHLNCHELEILPKTIGNLHNLQKLDLDCPQLKKLPDSIGNLKNLKVLKINCSGLGLKSLPDWISNLENLEELILDCLNQPILKDDICKLYNLKYLFLRNETKLPKKFGNLRNLEKLVIKNKVEDSYKIPESIAEIKNLIIEYDNDSFQQEYLATVAWKDAKKRDNVEDYRQYYQKYRIKFKECALAIKNKSYIEYIKFIKFRLLN